MCEELSVTDSGTPVVGVLESATAGADVVDAVTDEIDSRVERVTRGSLETVRAADPDLLVAFGDEGVSSVAGGDLETPVLPVGPVTGLAGVEPSTVGPALEAILHGEADCESHTVFAVAVDPADDAGEGKASEPARTVGCFDVTLDTDAPARISEFSVSSRGEPVTSFRADGVVLATPAGTHGYASAVCAPALSPAVEAMAVAPVAPFATRPRQWVLPPDRLRVAVVRDECTVDLVVDGTVVGSLESGWTVTIRAERSLSVVVPGGGQKISETE